jgi:hypothetical protein
MFKKRLLYIALLLRALISLNNYIHLYGLMLIRKVCVESLISTSSSSQFSSKLSQSNSNYL